MVVLKTYRFLKDRQNNKLFCLKKFEFSNRKKKVERREYVFLLTSSSIVISSNVVIGGTTFLLNFFFVFVFGFRKVKKPTLLTKRLRR